MAKSEEYKSQKSTESIEERKSNLDGKISISDSKLSGINLSEIDRVVIVDDVVVTGSTMSNTAQVLKQHGVREVYGLAIARNEKLEHIEEYADLIEQV